jgi:double zinc ribbon protein
MPDVIAFTNNFTDHSTNTGFQFEFHCDRCGDGVRSSFHTSALGTASTVIDVASNLLGGLFGASGVANSARNATWQREHDSALRAAMEEVKPYFTRCSRCTGYVCKSCWNESAGLCANCAPDMGGELAAAKSDAALRQMREKVDASVQFSGDISGKHTTCPKCGAPTGDMKFCGSCGTPIGLRKCPKGHEVGPGMRFCGECGASME